MKYAELKDKDKTDLDNALADGVKHLFDLRTQAVTEKLEDPTQFGKAKRDIARIKTAMRQLELAK